MTKPKIVLFDLGKVLVHFDWAIAARRIAPRCRYPAEALLAHMMKSPLLPRYESGLLESREFFGEIQREIAYRGTFEEFANEFGDIFSEIPEMVGFQARVRKAGHPVYVFSNTNDLAVQHIRKNFPFFSNFDGYFLSYELRAMKPAPGIYEAAERTTGCSGAEILYIDDFEENVAAGSSRGWQVIQHHAPARTIAQASEMLLS